MNSDIKNKIIQELKGLPENKMKQVLNYMLFLKERYGKEKVAQKTTD